MTESSATYNFFNNLTSFVYIVKKSLLRFVVSVCMLIYNVIVLCSAFNPLHEFIASSLSLFDTLFGLVDVMPTLPRL